MATKSSFDTEKEIPLMITGEPTDQLPEEDLDLDDDDLDDADMDDDDDEPYEGIRHGEEEDEGMVDDNMSGMPVVPSPS